MLELHEARALFSLWRERFAEAAARLNALDRAIGDGDHGTTMARAFQAAEARVQAEEFTDLGALFDAAAATFAETAGGAIGPLFSALLAQAGTTFADATHVDLQAVTRAFEQGQDAVQAVGQAEVGEKTLLDALAPAVQTLRAQVERGPRAAFEAALAAARRGAAGTAALRAAHGRARFLGERSRGHEDPGAHSISLLLEACHDLIVGVRAAPPDEAAKVAHPTTPPPGKLLNDPTEMIREELEGLARAHPHHLRLTEHPGVLARAQPKARGKVGLAMGHGGGHTPSMAGFIGAGLLDADAYGSLFTCASGVRIAHAIAAANRGAGVVLLVSNHTGDVLNARLALHRAQQLGIETRMTLLTDDVATAPRASYHKRRGLGGLLFALKVGGAAAEAGASLDEVAALIEHVNERTATLSVAVRSGTHPATGEPLMNLSPGNIEIGTGVHGESGVYSGPHLPADKIAERIVAPLVEDLDTLIEGKKLWAFVNGAGGTSMMELHIVYRGVVHALQRRGLHVADGIVNSYFTTQETGGFSLSLCALDDETAVWWDAPAHSAYFCKHERS
ncbi:MAG: dihydroxyacetone kinase subunit DhaL [Anaerolineae bacterium]